MPQAKQPSAGWFQAEILKSLQEVKAKVDESLLLGRQNGEDIRSLRKELGVDGLHGRIPQLEQAMARLDRQQEDDNKQVLGKIEELGKKQHDDKNKLVTLMDECDLKLEQRIKVLEMGDSESRGRKKLMVVLLSLLSGSASGAVITIAYHMMQAGLPH